MHFSDHAKKCDLLAYLVHEEQGSSLGNYELGIPAGVGPECITCKVIAVNRTGCIIYHDRSVATFLPAVRKSWLFDRTYPTDQINSRRQNIETLSQCRLSGFFRRFNGSKFFKLILLLGSICF
jgi:hypothetical protein